MKALVVIIALGALGCATREPRGANMADAAADAGQQSSDPLCLNTTTELDALPEAQDGFQVSPLALARVASGTWRTGVNDQLEVDFAEGGVFVERTERPGTSGSGSTEPACGDRFELNVRLALVPGDEAEPELEAETVLIVGQRTPPTAVFDVTTLEGERLSVHASFPEGHWRVVVSPAGDSDGATGGGSVEQRQYFFGGH